MDLEKTRSQLQEECITLDEVLKKSKQKEVCIVFLLFTRKMIRLSSFCVTNHDNSYPTVNKKFNIVVNLCLV